MSWQSGLWWVTVTYGTEELASGIACRHPTMPPMKHCWFCWKAFASQQAVNQHISASKMCLKEWHKNIVRKDNNHFKCRHINSLEPELEPSNNFIPPPEPCQGTPSLEANVEPEDKASDKDQQFIEPFPGHTGEALRWVKTSFEYLQQKQQLEEKTPWKPFANKPEWELAEWLMENVGQKLMDEYLQLLIVSWHLCSIYKNSLFYKVNSCEKLLFHKNYTI